MRGMFCVLAAVAGGGVAAASTFHSTLVCMDCHRGGDGIRPADEVKLCLRCHAGSSAAPDVLRGRLGPGGLEFAGDGGLSGGVLNLLGGGEGVAGRVAEHTGHTIGSTQPPPGFDGQWGGGPLTCRSCHGFHPNGNYRNLGPDPIIQDPAYRALAERLFPPEAQPSFATVAPGSAGAAAGADVLVADGAQRYDAGSVTFSTNGGRNAMNAFCASCHTYFHGAGNTRERSGAALEEPPVYVRHPTSDVAILGDTLSWLARAAHPPRLNWREDGTPEVACLTCHRAHGTMNPFGLVHWDPAAPANGESGAAPVVESLCMTCHSLGYEDADSVVRTLPRPPGSGGSVGTGGM